jgi:predicted RNA methylase
MKYQNIREEELKNKIAQDYFWIYDCSKIFGNVDFCVCMHQSQKELFEQESLLWAEAKKGSSDIYNSIVQLILTIGKARTFDKFLPPAMLGAFDGGKIAFIPYNDIHEVFYINDFNWNVTPSNHSTKEFKLIHEKVKTIIDTKTLLFDFLKDDRELKKFIKNNFIVGKFGLTKTKIDKNNFMVIYNKWLQNVKATISVNWEVAKKSGIIDGDFYIADLLSHENNTLKEKLFVLLKHDHYELDRKLNQSGLFSHSETSFTDKQVAHTQFWNKYDRPPKEEYWDYIVERRDLLVPQDVRERKGSFFTPQIWVELSQKYLTDVLGVDWQDEYYVWDCAAGTGNLFAGLTNKYNIWASTLDNQDVEVIHDRIKNGANLLDDHVFQFDFLNDDFSKLPKPLQEIINNPEKRKKLVVYINPPYAEHGNRTTISDHGVHKSNVANTSKVYDDFNKIVGTATRELFAQFFLRIHKELPESILASFSTVKFMNSQNFSKFRQLFKVEFKKGFICNANTFDNVKGNFPISFLIWDLKSNDEIKHIITDVIEENEQEIVQQKSFYAFDNKDFISNWLRKFYDKSGKPIGFLILPGVDMQQQNGVYFTIQPTDSDIKQHKTAAITEKNLIEMSIYLAIRQCISPNWKNNKDQFLFPNDLWISDSDFQNDCLIYSLFHGQNKASLSDGTNNWIPFTEQEVNSREKFESNFMSKFINGKLKTDSNGDLFANKTQRTTPLTFSTEAKTVLDFARELWKYYHRQPNCNVNASLYDIREHFQGRNEAGKMNNKSSDETYMNLIGDLREKLKQLADNIEPKVYEYEFLKQ